MARASDVLVAKRNYRWEVSVGGLCRRMFDWFATKERAIGHALELAAQIDGATVIVETFDGQRELVGPIERRRNA